MNELTPKSAFLDHLRKYHEGFRLLSWVLLSPYYGGWRVGTTIFCTRTHTFLYILFHRAVLEEQ
jgi:hypothetical protein